MILGGSMSTNLSYNESLYIFFKVKYDDHLSWQFIRMLRLIMIQHNIMKMHSR